MSPEQFRGERPDHRTDIYSLGLMAYELLGPRHPFANEDGSMPDEFELARRHDALEPVPLPGLCPNLPDDVWQIVRKALSKRPADRQPRIRDVAAELRAARGRYLSSRGPRAFAKDWRGSGSFATHGAMEPPGQEEAPHLPSRKVVVGKAEVEAREEGDRSSAPSGAHVIHVTVGRNPRAIRRRRGRAATLAIAVACVLVLAAAAAAWRMVSGVEAVPPPSGDGGFRR
jgi:hypothetical protein